MKDKISIRCGIEVWRNGARRRELAGISQLRVRMSAGAGIKTSFSAGILWDSDFDPINDRLCPYQEVDGERYPLGEYLVSTATLTQRDGHRIWDVEALDQGLLLQQTTIGEALRFGAGTAYLDAVRQILALCGVDRVIETPCDRTMAFDREDWEIGTPCLAIVNGLLEAIGYESLFFDRLGRAVLGPIQAALAQNVALSYGPGAWSGPLGGDITRESDLYGAYNVFTAVSSVPGAPAMVATAVNDNPLSPVSTRRRGRRICAPVIVVEEAASPEALQAVADRRMEQAMFAGEAIAFSTLPVPRHWVGDLVALSGVVYRETDWELLCGAKGSFWHRARRAVVL